MVFQQFQILPNGVTKYLMLILIIIIVVKQTPPVGARTPLVIYKRMQNMCTVEVPGIIWPKCINNAVLPLIYNVVPRVTANGRFY